MSCQLRRILQAPANRRFGVLTEGMALLALTVAILARFSVRPSYCGTGAFGVPGHGHERCRACSARLRWCCPGYGGGKHPPRGVG